MAIFKYGAVELDYLQNRDKKLGAAINRIGLIEREVIPDLFTALVNSIVGQQIFPKAAATVWNRMLARLGEINPPTIAAASLEEIQACGLSMRKAGYIKGIGESVLQGGLDLSALNELPDIEIIKRLSALNGVFTSCKCKPLCNC